MNYVEIYKDLEECYDQIVHPQKRKSLQVFLETVMSRMVEVYKLITKHYSDKIKFDMTKSDTTGDKDKKEDKKKVIDFLILNDEMFTNKKTPKDLEVNPPRYFRETKEFEQKQLLLDQAYLYAFGTED